MKIRSIRIENFRGFQDETIHLNRYTCFVGPNGVGKSTVLSALNVFFQERSGSSGDVAKLINEDYFDRQTERPARITLELDELGLAAQEVLAAYVRNGTIVVSAEAEFNPSIGYGQIRHIGQRSGLERFRPYFDALKQDAKFDQLRAIYRSFQQEISELPTATSKEAQIAALHKFESEHLEQCTPIPSTDNFYGISGAGKLAPFIQWVYVPAVKDAGEEGLEGKNTALGRLIARAVRSRTPFDQDIESLRAETFERYRALLDQNQVTLTEISQSLQRRLASWAHPNVQLGLEWLSDPVKSVSVQQPIAGIKTGDGGFVGSLARMGHGLQRSYLLALLQELASSDAQDAPTLILGCEEPELYQHPPQARHLADVFAELTDGTNNTQVVVTTHSPLFVSGEGFENTRLVRKTSARPGSVVSGLAFDNLCARMREARGESTRKPVAGLVAKIHQALQPHISDMFFTKTPILVEGLEDVAYITTQLHISGQWEEYRGLGCYLIPTHGKDNMIQPLAIARELQLPTFVVFDSDGNLAEDHRGEHERENRALIRLLGVEQDAFPSEDVFGSDHVIWKTKIGDAISSDFDRELLSRLHERARARFTHESNLEKKALYIAEWLTMAHNDHDIVSATLVKVCTAILDFARRQ